MIILTVQKTHSGHAYRVARADPRDVVVVDDDEEVVIALLESLGVPGARQMLADAKQFGVLEILDTETENAQPQKSRDAR